MQYWHRTRQKNGIVQSPKKEGQKGIHISKMAFQIKLKRKQMCNSANGTVTNPATGKRKDSE